MSLNTAVTRDLASLLPEVLRLVDAAGTAILEVYASGHDVEYKADDSPITRADRAAHDILSAGLRQLTPDIPVLSEESAAEHAPEVRHRWSDFWLIDPLDGTREFINRNGEFTVNVALVRDHKPVLGVVAAPVLNLVYYGVAGVGAFVAHDGRRRAAHPRASAGRGPARDRRQPLAPRRLARQRARADRGARDAADGQLAQVLPGRRGDGGLLPAPGPDLRMGHRGRAGSGRGGRRRR